MSSLFKEIYIYIKPFKEIFYDKYFMDKYYFLKSFYEFMNTVYANDNQTDVGGKKINCKWIHKIYNYLLLLLLFICILWILYELYVKNMYIINSFINNILSKNILLKDIPEFNQLNNIIYFADNFSLDINLLFIITLAIIILCILTYFYYIINLNIVFKEFSYIILFSIIIIISGIFYYILNFSYINSISRRNRVLTNLIYKNINLHFINSQGLCNYIHKKNEFDDDFAYGKCNDLKYNSNKTKLIAYIKNIINDAYNTEKTLTLEKFKSLKDSNGIYYKTKLSSAFYTYTLISYYIDKSLINEAKDIFSSYNLIKYLLKSQINPLLNIKSDEILIGQTSNDLDYNNLDIQIAFNNNKDIYNYIYADYYNTNSTIQTLIVDIYNICKYKMTSIYIYYIIITLIMVFLILIYFIVNYYNIKIN